MNKVVLISLLLYLLLYTNGAAAFVDVIAVHKRHGSLSEKTLKSIQRKSSLTKILASPTKIKKSSSVSKVSTTPIKAQATKITSVTKTTTAPKTTSTVKTTLAPKIRDLRSHLSIVSHSPMKAPAQQAFPYKARITKKEKKHSRKIASLKKTTRPFALSNKRLSLGVATNELATPNVMTAPMPPSKCEPGYTSTGENKCPTFQFLEPGAAKNIVEDAEAERSAAN